ncbi:TPA: glycosyltransferase family 2 protein [Candidatus Ventrenecus stercoripullorum]|nr:glycosyltransferase family 2 protein [Candidatus Ventrenecus stercoripullorum]
MTEELISIVVPVYNAEKFLNDTIQTVLAQTYPNWELLLVDDCSSDDSVSIIKKFAANDDRIHLLRNEKNSGAALTRNKGIEEAKGTYLCFLDADDLWEKEKLEKQLKFMKENHCAFSFTSYEFADSNGIPNGKKVKVPRTINYKQALKNTTIFTSTVMFDLNKLAKEDIYMPDVKSEDTATWWKILKKLSYAYGINNIVVLYRRSENTLSSNKIKALKRTWNLYRNVEELTFLTSIYNFSWYCFNALKRRV